MIRISQLANKDGESSDTLTLTFENRQKSRLRAILDSGEEAGLFLPRGTILRGGDRLLADDGRVVLVEADRELVSTAITDSPLLMMKASYHLGNRHVPLQISAEFIRYRQDHVLDQMVSSIGLEISHENAPFEPESGAYHSHGSHHHHAH